MNIYDCFMYFDENLLLELRFKELNKYVKKFIITESRYTHSGQKRKLLFDINKYSEFRDKIEYIVIDDEPANLKIINEKDDYNLKNSKYILNGMARDNYQRNAIRKGLLNLNPNDWILISDLDEIPDLRNINFNNIKNKFIFFRQSNYYYKFNLYLENFNWYGTKACKFKDLISPQWLRNMKDKKYPKWRIDVFFSKNKSNDIFFVKNGGWHFSYLKSPEDIEKKLKSYAHHREYELNPLGLDKINEFIKNRIAIYNLNTDMRNNKFSGGEKLEIQKNENLPIEIQKNLNYYKNWLEV